MTPDRLDEIRQILDAPKRPGGWWYLQPGDHQNIAEDLLAEVDRLRRQREAVRKNWARLSQMTTLLEKHERALQRVCQQCGCVAGCLVGGLCDGCLS